VIIRETEEADVTDQEYVVVVNHEEQYSVWPVANHHPPAGWHAVGMSGTKDECLAHIRETWTDMRPLSLRRHHGADDG
jgi:MbtH protein